MSITATTQHRFGDPIAMAAAVAVIIGGATLIGVAVAQDTPAPTVPAAPTHGKHVVPNPPSRVGLGDFTQSEQGGSPSAPLKGGHSMVGLP
jgi:hypothetical protein